MQLIAWTVSRFRHRRTAILLCGAVGLILASSAWASPAGEDAETVLGMRLPLWATIPFAGILLSIALFPLFAPRWWHHHFAKVSAFWGLSFAVPFLLTFRGEAIHEILHVYLLEYLPFIILLWALFTISGGVHLRGSLRGTPATNAVMLLIGTIIASWMGTTGASMIMIRPVIRANAWRRHKVHVIVLFIFLVSNIGGSLTPLGDPPLFLGFLLGVPFFWTMNLIVDMIFVSLPLLVLLYLLDRHYYRKETEKPSQTEQTPFRIDGAHNLLFLGGVIGAVLLSGMWRPGDVTVLSIHVPISGIVRDGLLIILGIVSLAVTAREVYKANEFGWFPIKEVAFLFAGIFMTIIPAISILKAGEEGALAFLIHSLDSPGHYFWVTGGLSSFLDNAPSYLTLFNSCLGKFYTGIPTSESVHMLIAERAIYLKAISIGAVFFGALTYIGNAPNFMVRSIAEEAGIRMPSFFGYMAKYSLPILLPLFFLITVVLL